ncbi:hypothetical protein EDEG_02760 [Edhazardia aedis USNM 41457]|uniref:Uncharacterized protein n=1 Tax=Edhazardia aedis (strain USNM 41457) TaxID=1003232 RepID=J9DN90_EDHAE|nr:hypothetical protein EDEG_02760 [Edhazardia aedis USNM 41457]|eukprot:EJW02847.1 hypothetical protein EDEG_02760 [Edhazardia aedis USNM 41457]
MCFSKKRKKLALIFGNLIIPMSSNWLYTFILIVEGAIQQTQKKTETENSFYSENFKLFISSSMAVIPFNIQICRGLNEKTNKTLTAPEDTVEHKNQFERSKVIFDPMDFYYLDYVFVNFVFYRLDDNDYKKLKKNEKEISMSLTESLIKLRTMEKKQSFDDIGLAIISEILQSDKKIVNASNLNYLYKSEGMFRFIKFIFEKCESENIMKRDNITFLKLEHSIKNKIVIIFSEKSFSKEKGAFQRYWELIILPNHNSKDRNLHYYDIFTVLKPLNSAWNSYFEKKIYLEHSKSILQRLKGSKNSFFIDFLNKMAQPDDPIAVAHGISLLMIFVSLILAFYSHLAN